LPPHIWTEASLLALGPDEFDDLEYKASAWVVAKTGRLHGEFPSALSKQLSAFANGGGGDIVIGVDDSGQVDGGVSTSFKAGGTRSWLEDVVPGLVDPPLSSFNVFEVLPSARPSAIRPGHAVYVIHVPSSDNAPHQAIDKRYYLRIAGKSRPMGHLHIQDVLARTRNPSVSVLRVAPFGPVQTTLEDRRGPKATVRFRIQVKNSGRRLAHHLGMELMIPRTLVNREVRRRMSAEEGVQLSQRPGAVQFYRYLPHPLFPGQALFFLNAWIAVHRTNLDALRMGQGLIKWRVYADDAQPTEGSQDLADFARVKEAMAWVQSHLDDV